MSDPNVQGMQALAEAMIDAGCEGVVGLLADGNGVLALADGRHPSQMSEVLRAYADAIDSINPATDMVGRVTVERPDEEEPE